MPSRHSFLLAAFAALALAGMPHAAKAGVFSDELSKCLVQHTSDDDKIALTRWIFVVMAAHPSNASIVTVDEPTRMQVSRKTAELFQRLLTASCRQQTADAMKYEGTAALTDGFKTLGGVAMTTVLSNPEVAKEASSYVKYMDMDEIKRVLGPQAVGSGQADRSP